MRPLTDHCPKPLLDAGGEPLICWHLRRLAAAGIRDIVVNHAHLGAMIETRLGDGSAWGVSIRYSPEGQALETAGGIAQALPLLGEAPFLVVNGDIWCDFDLARAHGIAERLADDALLGWCVLVPNPPHHVDGDFGLDHGLLSEHASPRHTFSGIGVYRPALFDGIPHGTRARPSARCCARAPRPGASAANCTRDSGPTSVRPERLAQLDARPARATVTPTQ
jgi:MurNAc alpha-1-phosphate uridylyltransferase